MRTFVELVERYVDPELCPYPEYKGKPYYSIKYIENGEEYVGYSTYSLRVMSEFLKKYFISSAPEKQEQANTQNINSTHTSRPNALESLNILEQAKDDKGNVPMSLVRQAFRNVMEQDRWIPVTVRLPEDDCECRVTSQNNFGKYVFDCYWNEGKKQFESWNYFLDDYVPVSGVTAWKPIEEPYTEEES
jgi:hypothetical protein